jgi:hypothetical protein
MNTLQLMRGLAKEFASLGVRPKWVDADAHPAVHFDQFLHAYYYDYVRGGGGGGEDEDDDLSGLEKVDAFFNKHRAKPGDALKEAVRWWASLPSERYGEETFIRETAPEMRKRLSRDALSKMDLASFTEALRYVNAFRMHARQWDEAARETSWSGPRDCPRPPVFVGRVRDDLAVSGAIKMVISADNLRRGAALNAVQIAESSSFADGRAR